MSYFTSKVLSAALLSLAPLISANPQAPLYPEWYGTLIAEYPDVNWEAHTLTTGDFTKTLMHLTGKKSDSSFEATKQPVLMVGGGVSNMLSWFNTETPRALYGKSKY